MPIALIIRPLDGRDLEIAPYQGRVGRDLEIAPTKHGLVAIWRLLLQKTRFPAASSTIFIHDRMVAT